MLRLMTWPFVLLTLLAMPLPASGEEQRPNIVFILVDDLSWSDLACYGNRIHETPNIDRLAREGMRFTQAYAPAPICSASRAALLTGKTPARLNFEFVTKSKPGQQTLKTPLQSPPYTMNLPLQETTIGEALKTADYVTGFFGKWHVNQHYQEYLGWSPTHGPFMQGFAEGDSHFGSHPYAYRKHPNLRKQPVTEGKFPKDTLTDKAIGFIQKHRERPFFLYLSQYFVHDPIHTRCEWLIGKYRDRLPTGAKEIRASYGAMVETLDHNVGRVLNSLDQAGLTDKTLVLLMSDNGGHPNYTSNAPLRGSKWNLYEGGIRVPLILRWPNRISGNSLCETPTHGCDLFPTFCEVAGIHPMHRKWDGQSLVSLFRNPQATLDRPTPLVWHFPYYHPEKGFGKAPAEIGIGDFVTSQTRPQSAIRKGDWKLVHFYEDDRTELYDLKNDIGEQTNLAHHHPNIAANLKENLTTYLKKSEARFPSRNSADGASR